MEAVTIEAASRTADGTRAARRLRQSGQLPAIVYGHGEPPQVVSLPEHDVLNELHHGNHLLRVKLGGVEQRLFVKEVQYDHLGTNPIHLDLTRVNLDERVTVTVPVELRGIPEGIKAGGVLDQVVGDIEIECVVTSIPEAIRPNVSHLGIGDSLHVKDMTYPEGVKPISPPDEVICTVRVLAEPTEEEEVAEESAAAAEPELIRRPKEEESSED